MRFLIFFLVPILLMSQNSKIDSLVTLLELNKKDESPPSKLGDYTALVDEMRDLESQVESLRNRLRSVREREEKKT